MQAQEDMTEQKVWKQHLDKGGVQDISGPGALSMAGSGAEAAAAGGAAAGVWLGIELLGGAPELHHLHPPGLPHHPLCLLLQQLQRSACTRALALQTGFLLFSCQLLAHKCPNDLMAVFGACCKTSIPSQRVCQSFV